MSFLKEITRFTHNERLGLAGLMIVITALSAAYFFHGFFDVQLKDDQLVLKKSDSLLAVMHREKKEAARLDSIKKQERYDSLQSARNNPFRSEPNNPARPRKKFVFNPNVISIDSLELLGFQTGIAKAVINYRNAGGSFSSAEDLKKIYHINKELVDELAAYIQIPEEEEDDEQIKKGKSRKYVANSGSDPGGTPAGRSVRKENYDYNGPKLRSINLNEADTGDLTQIYGIGNYYAAVILDFREQLGGFINTQQLREIRKLPDSVVDQAEPYFYVEKNFVPKKKNINTLSAYSLGRHPYLTNHLAVSIVSFRRREGDYDDPKALLNFGLFTDELYIKIAPYLTTAKDNLKLKENE